MLISILGNALVLAAIIRTPSIRSTSMSMICSLAVSDLLVGFLVQPIYIGKELTEDRSVYYIWRMIGPSLSGVSLLTMTAISVDRFLALHYHMIYATLVTKTRVKYTWRCNNEEIIDKRILKLPQCLNIVFLTYSFERPLCYFQGSTVLRLVLEIVFN